MKPVLLIAIVAVVMIGVMVPSVFAETYEVTILATSTDENCNSTDSCLDPSEITILRGDTIKWIRIPDVGLSIVGINDTHLISLDYTKTFTSTGVYEYSTSDFPWVYGVINVQYSQNVNGLPNSIKFTSAEIIDNLQLLLI